MRIESSQLPWKLLGTADVHSLPLGYFSTSFDTALFCCSETRLIALAWGRGDEAVGGGRCRRLVRATGNH